MKPIKITQNNESIIVAELLKCNGNSMAHTYTDFYQINNVGKAAEKQLLELVKKKLAPGAKFISQSGAALPSAYKYSRQVTTVQIERRASDWYLVSVNCHTANNEAGKNRLILTKTQRDFAVSKFCNQFSVEELIMKLYPSYDSLPNNAIYLGSDDMPGYISESTADMIDNESFGKYLAYIVDASGFRSFFMW